MKGKARARHTSEDLFELAKEEGMEIPDELLDVVAGGSWSSDHEWGCPADKCGSYLIGP